MNYYQDITLLPDADISLGFLWQKVYQQVHIALVEQKIDAQHSDIAVSFPEFNERGFPLGSKLRLLAKEQTRLEQLDLARHLARLQDYIHLKSIQPVPESSRWVAFVRKHIKGQTRRDKDTLEKAILWSKKSGQEFDVCLQKLQQSQPKVGSKLPFIWLESQETKAKNPNGSARFPLFIERIELKERQEGLFNCYGLSAQSGAQLTSVPHF